MLSTDKKIKNVILSLILLTLTITGIVIICYQNYLLKSHIHNEMKNQNLYINKTFNLFVDELDKNISERTNFMLSLSVREAFANKNREKLYSIVKNDYERMLKSNKYLKIITFRLSDGSAFLRVHKPEMYGDSLNTKRKIILDSIYTQKRQFGFEIGKLKMTHRVVTPVFYDNKLVGVVEVGIEPEYIIEKMNNIFNIESSLFVKNDNMSVSMHKFGDNYKYAINDYVFVRGSSVVKNNLSEIDLDKKESKISLDGKNYYIDSIELLDYKGNVAAKMLISYDLAKYTKEFDEMLEKNILITLLLIVILFIILNIGLNYFLKKIDKLYINILKKDKMLLQQSKLASMGEMVGNIAHQWRQPLNVISTSASALKVENELGVLSDENLNSTIDGIVNNTKYLSQTINDFMDFVRNDKKVVSFNIKDNINKNLEILKGSLKIHQINMIVECKDEYLKGFPNQLTQVFVNIIHNAKDALKEKDIEDRYIFVTTEKVDDNTLEIRIKDNAKGIDEKIIDKIFDPYFTTKADSQGTGLGLYMSYRIVNESMKGRITAENVEYEYKGEKFKGALFTLSLPLNI